MERQSFTGKQYFQKPKYGNNLELIKRFFRPSASPFVSDVPKKTLVLSRNPRSNAFWWHLGSSGDQQEMQVVGDVTVTNICKHPTYVTAAKLKKPEPLTRGYGDELVSEYSGGYMIPTGSQTDLRFHFQVMPPAGEKGQTFKADIAIIDLFGNEHWIKGIEFPYSDRLQY